MHGVATHGAMNLYNVERHYPQRKHPRHIWRSHLFFCQKLKNGAPKQNTMARMRWSFSPNSCAPKSISKITQKFMRKTKEIKKSLGRKNVDFSAGLDLFWDFKVETKRKVMQPKGIARIVMVNQSIMFTSNIKISSERSTRRWVVPKIFTSWL